ncbi:MAG TPA: RNA 2',3'-cyclic phosphodiesterase [Thermodesulfovibrionales bacterium]|nr:RNA 2',3'-cyclic phosphodiesterase [Thermodesulfovibrionales bacterium]
MGIRCFIAIPLDAVIRKEISSFIDYLGKSGADVKWVRAENLHITLKFLGDTEEYLLPDIKEKLSNISSLHKPFTVHLSGTGLFPDRRKPRVVWIDFGGGQELSKLQETVEENLASLGYNKEKRRFSPHLTVGRVRSSRNLDSLLRGMEEQRDKDFGNIEVASFLLMKSDLKPGGAEYAAIAEFNLKKEEK